MSSTGRSQKVMWPMKPSSRAERSSVSSSWRGRLGSRRRQEIAAKQESQYHCQG